jgi:NAD-dependent deacetylase
MAGSRSGARPVNPLFSSRLLTALHTAHTVTAFTGAGVSAESGVPTFRGTDGIWKKFKPEELATIDAFMRNPELVWEWYAHRKKIIDGIEPNPGHVALARMEKLFPAFAVITQNIDNLHRRAGSTIVHELHGNIERNYCITCGTPYGKDAVADQQGAPRCTSCGGLIRPDVVWFGEMLPEDEWESSVRAAESADVFLSIGTSGVVFPAASLPMMAKQAGAYLVEINPEETPLTERADEFVKGPSGQLLPMLLEQMEIVRQE